MRRWTEDEIQQVIKMTSNGTAPMNISKKLKRTPNEVRMKIWKLGIEEKFLEYHSDKLTSVDIAKLIGMDRRTVARWISEGKISCTKKGSINFVTEKDLHKFMQEYPNKWMPSRCDREYFRGVPFYEEALERERQGEKQYHWTVARRRWNENERNTLMRLVAQGYSESEIAEKMGKTKKCVECYIIRNQLRNRENNCWYGKV